jgi:hypothetical protein
MLPPGSDSLAERIGRDGSAAEPQGSRRESVNVPEGLFQQAYRYICALLGGQREDLKLPGDDLQARFMQTELIQGN